MSKSWVNCWCKNPIGQVTSCAKAELQASSTEVWKVIEGWEVWWSTQSFSYMGIFWVKISLRSFYGTILGYLGEGHWDAGFIGVVVLFFLLPSCFFLPVSTASPDPNPVESSSMFMHLLAQSGHTDPNSRAPLPGGNASVECQKECQNAEKIPKLSQTIMSGWGSLEEIKI